VLKTKNAQNEARAIANEMGRVNLDVTKQLKETQIQLGKNQGILSGINAKVAEMRERGLTKEEENLFKRLDLMGQKIDAESDNLSYKTDAEMNAALLSSATSKANIGLVDPRAKATEAALATSVMQNEATQQLLPGQTSNAIKKQGLDSANIGIAQETIQQGGGVGGMADRNIRKDDLAMEATQVGIDKNKSYIAYLNANAKKALTKSPQNTSIENNITGLKKEIDTIMKSPSFVKDEDGNALDIEDLFTISASGEVEISEDANVLSKRDIDRLVELVKKQTNLRLSQTTNIVDGNGNLKEVTVAQKEQMIRAKEAQLQAAEQARQQKENEESLKQAEQARLLF
jgi:hypothetical protein